MKTNNVYLFFFLILISIAGCRKDSITTDVTTIPNEPEINIETTLNGFITDRNGEPIPEAEVSILNATTQTNEFGFFEISGLVNEKFAVIKVEKPGYFNQFETLIPSKTAINRTRIQLTEKGPPETISSDIGGQVSISQNSSVDFLPNSFIDEQGNAYNGNVNIYSFYIDPTDPDIDQIMPGNMMARNTANDLRVLESFGMVKVELEGDTGQKLNINKTATLTIEVPNSIANNAPTEIPLWFFDEEKGLWMEEGNAILQNGKYVGEVEHFTFWNCDVPFNFTQVQGQVINDIGAHLAKIKITDLATGASFYDWTNTDGYFTGGVPKNTDLLFEIIDLCGSVLYNSNIGPFTSDQENLGIFNISSNNNLITITGSLVNCDLQPVTNGQVLLSFTNQFFPQQVTTNSNGEFMIVTTSCGATEIELLGIDFDNSTLGDPQTFPLISTMDIGNLIVCGGTYPESVILTTNGITKIIPNCSITFSINPSNNADEYLFEFTDYETGGNPVTYNWSFQDTNNDITDPEWIIITSYDTPVPIDTLSVFSSFGIVSGTTITVLQEAVNPGDIMSIKVDNCLISTKIYDSMGNTFLSTDLNSTAIINGTRQ